MCSAYELGKRKGALPEWITEVGSKRLLGIEGLRLIRRTDEAPVILGDGAIRSMRWGFERPGLGVVNNSRSDKLSGPMWRDAYQNRRCLIPAAAFYEWSGPKGRKRTHRFDAPDEGWLWIAGLWEECPRLGACFSMITTDANSLMAPIHDRMPAVLAPAELMPYLQGLVARFAPPSEALRVMDAPNPLVKHKPESVQGELF